MRYSHGAVVILAIILFLPACSNHTLAPSLAPPGVPAEYYNCIEAKPRELVDAYYSKYFVIQESQARYDNLVFVFKNIEFTDSLNKHLAEGYVYVDVIKCFCSNINDLARYHFGDKIDIIGVNKGIIKGEPGLLFIDCIILPAGCIELPAVDGRTLIPGY
jgi:hypothetical protein